MQRSKLFAFSSGILPQRILVEKAGQQVTFCEKEKKIGKEKNIKGYWKLYSNFTANNKKTSMPLCMWDKNMMRPYDHHICFCDDIHDANSTVHVATQGEEQLL